MNVTLGFAKHIGSSPTKPVFALRVGIVGHRPKDSHYAPHSEIFVKQRLKDIFEEVSSCSATLAVKFQNIYDKRPIRIRLVSGLAEGADQWALEVMPPGWILEAVLPFPRSVYREDFKHSAANDGQDVTPRFDNYLNMKPTVVEMPEEPALKDASLKPEERQRLRAVGYRRAGAFLLGQVDLLIAVWDGRIEGAVGGTSEIVSAALDAEIPVFWVNSLEDVFAKKVDEIDNGQIDAPDADCLLGTLAEAVEIIVSLPVKPESGEATAKQPGKYADVGTRLGEFFAEIRPKPLARWLTYDLFKRIHEGNRIRWKIDTDSGSNYEELWARLDDNMPAAGKLCEHIRETLLTRFGWANSLAVDYSHRFRSSYFNCFLAAAFAVFLALLGIFVHYIPNDELQLTIKAMLVIVETWTICWIVQTVRRGLAERWKEKWLEYRTLAELLLNVRFLAYLGEHGRAHRLGDLEPESSAWLLWYLRATIREIGLPDAQFDGAYQRALLRSVREHVISDQRRWHRNNASTLNRMHRSLHRLSDACFFATTPVLVFFLILWLFFLGGMFFVENARVLDIVGILPGGPSLEKALNSAGAPYWEMFGGRLLEIKDLVLFVAALLPATGAAFASIRETGDFEKIAEHSEKTAVRLDELHREFEKAEKRLRLDETGDLLLSTAQVLTEDLSAWQSVYGHKRLELPA